MLSFLDLVFLLGAAGVVFGVGVITGFLIQVFLKIQEPGSPMAFEQWRKYLDPRGSRHPTPPFWLSARVDAARAVSMLKRNGRH
jgi:hypothetical protein